MAGVGQNPMAKKDDQKMTFSSNKTLKNVFQDEMLIVFQGIFSDSRCGQAGADLYIKILRSMFKRTYTLPLFNPATWTKDDQY